MTESEWQTCTTKPTVMYRLIRARLSPRRLQLLACAICRLMPEPAAEPWCWESVGIAERAVDGVLSDAATLAAVERVRHFAEELATRQMTTGDVRHEAEAAANAVLAACGSRDIAEKFTALLSWVERCDQLVTPRGQKLGAQKTLRRRMCDLMREIAGDPYRDYVRFTVDAGDGILQPGGVPFVIPETPRLLAKGIYSDAAFDRLPILADALEEAGMTDRPLLDHLRQGAGHIRGCWALDLLFGEASFCRSVRSFAKPDT